MVKSFVLIAALSLAACGKAPTLEDRANIAKNRSPETVRIICNQQGTRVFEEDAIDWYSLNGGISGTLADGSRFSVAGSACIIKEL